ncbi:MAG: hypothetical protein MJH09_12710, partial [Cetobacterium sp.]|nr:hypothetical protein [Cetobacterium sp.]
VIESIRTAKPFGRSYATSKKLLWEGNLGTGSFTLNEDIRNYDKILFYCTDDTNRYMSGQIYDVETLKKFKESGKYFNINTQLEGTYWYVSLGDDFRTFVMQSENSRVRIVFGVND